MLDIASHWGADIDAAMAIASNLDDLADRQLLHEDSTIDVMPDLIARLHDLISMAHRNTDRDCVLIYFCRAICLMDDFVRKHLLEPLEVYIRLKHAYNVKRPYRHGGKAC
jgi:hypothetical protein